MSSTVTLKIKIDDKQFDAKIENAEQQLKGLRGKSTSVSDSLAKWGMIVTGFNQALELAGTLVSVLEKPIGTSAMFEQFEVQLKVLLGNLGSARERLAELSEFGKTTPYEFPEVVKANRVVEVLTKGALSGVESMTMIGDVAAGVGIRIDELAMWFGRLYDGIQSGRPVGEALMRLQELGALSGDARGEIEKLQKQNADSTKVWAVVTKEMGKFNGMMDAQSATWNGLVSNIEDAVTLIMKDVGDILLPTLKSLAETTIDILGIFSSGTDVLKDQQVEFNALVDILTDLNTEEDTRLRAIKELQDKYPNYLGNIDLEKSGVEELYKMQKKANEEFEKKILMMAAEEELASLKSDIVSKQKELFDLELKLKEIEAAGQGDQIGSESFNQGFDTMRLKADINEVKNGIAESKQQYQDFLNYISENGIDFTKPDDGKDDGRDGGNKKPIEVPVRPKIVLDDIDLDADEILKNIKLMADFDVREMQIERMNEGLAKEQALLELWRDRQLDIYKEDANARSEIQSTFLDRQLQIEDNYAKKRASIKRAEHIAEIDSARETLNMLSAMIAKHTVFGKMTAIAEATMNTYLRATEALGNPIKLAIGIIAQGITQVHRIMSTKVPQMPAYEHGGAIVGENGVEIIAPARDFGEGMDNLIATVRHTLMTQNYGSSIDLEGLREEIRSLASRPAIAYLNDREAQKVVNSGLYQLSREGA